MLDLETAKHHGICPRCESYGGGDSSRCENSTDCTGSCPRCWCPGCHDGQDFPESRIAELDSGEPCGSWEAYELVKASQSEGER